MPDDDLRSQSTTDCGRRSAHFLPTRTERGASAVEYGLLIAGIAALIIIGVFAFGGGTNGLFRGSCDDIIEAQSLGSCG